jgi:uncharacterized membrane protein
MLTHGEILEIGKLLSDLFKVITTLDTVMIGLIITIVEKVFTPEKVFKSRTNKVLLGACLLSFILSLAFSLIALVFIPTSLADILQGGAVRAWVDNCSFYGSILLFIFGIVLFIFLAVVVFSSSTLDRQVSAPQQKRLIKKSSRRR